MKMIKKFAFTVFAMAIFFVCTLISANALSKAQEAAVNLADNSLTVEAMGITYDVLSKSHQKTARKMMSVNGFKDDKTKAMALTDDEIAEIAKKFADNALVFIVELPDGTETYNISVDFRTEDSYLYYNPVLLRNVAINLIERISDISDKRKGVHTIMDYTHVVGELTIHFLGYRFSMKLGGETSNGLMGYIYDKCSIAYLNIDEDRFSVMIRFLGIVVG